MIDPPSAYTSLLRREQLYLWIQTSSQNIQQSRPPTLKRKQLQEIPVRTKSLECMVLRGNPYSAAMMFRRGFLKRQMEKAFRKYSGNIDEGTRINELYTNKAHG